MKNKTLTTIKHSGKFRSCTKRECLQTEPGMKETSTGPNLLARFFYFAPLAAPTSRLRPVGLFILMQAQEKSNYGRTL